MNKKLVYLGLAVGLLAVIIVGSFFSDETKEVSKEEYDSAYYVENNRNIIIRTAKILDKCCYYVVDVVVSSVGSVFNSILGN
ncbi:MAG: hypothetical protein K2I42_04210 [Anaeroplasmataceae bacterium]|nr:hypothetical protein [Anaeroplasmataceae bacterium]